MKKKMLIIMAVAAALAVMPVATGAAESAHYSSDGSESSSSTSTGRTIGAGSGSSSSQNIVPNAAVVSNQPTVQVTNAGNKVAVASMASDITGAVTGLVGESAGNGAVNSNGVNVSFAIGNVAEISGLPETVVASIKALYTTANVSTVFPEMGLEGYSKVGGTHALIVKDAQNQDAKAKITLYVASLPADYTEVRVLCYENMTNTWSAIKDVTVDVTAKTVSFWANGSCTFQVITK